MSVEVEKRKGGKRPGAGRPKGVANKVTGKRKQIAADLLDDGVTPLEVMTATMRALWAEAADDEGKVIDMEKAKDACAIADRCAPYMHPRLAATTVDANVNMSHEDALAVLE